MTKVHSKMYVIDIKRVGSFLCAWVDEKKGGPKMKV